MHRCRPGDQRRHHSPTRRGILVLRGTRGPKQPAGCDRNLPNVSVARPVSGPGPRHSTSLRTTRIRGPVRQTHCDPVVFLHDSRRNHCFRAAHRLRESCRCSPSSGAETDAALISALSEPASSGSDAQRHLRLDWRDSRSRQSLLARTDSQPDVGAVPSGLPHRPRLR